MTSRQDIELALALAVAKELTERGLTTEDRYWRAWGDAGEALMHTMSAEHQQLLVQALECRQADPDAFWRSNTPGSRLLGAFQSRIVDHVGPEPGIPPWHPGHPLALPPAAAEVYMSPELNDEPGVFTYCEEHNECIEWGYLLPVVARSRPGAWRKVVSLDSCPLCGGPRHWPKSIAS